jgi:acyl carrier protein
MEDPSFERLVETIREQCRLRPNKRVAPETQFERDLGVTGDDGEELLEAVEERFGVKFTRESFGLEPNEVLFGPEANFPGFDDLLSVFGKRPTKTLRTFTAGELFEVVKRELGKTSGNHP